MPAPVFLFALAQVCKHSVLYISILREYGPPLGKHTLTALCSICVFTTTAAYQRQKLRTGSAFLRTQKWQTPLKVLLCGTADGAFQYRRQPRGVKWLEYEYGCRCCTMSVLPESFLRRRQYRHEFSDAGHPSSRAILFVQGEARTICARSRANFRA